MVLPGGVSFGLLLLLLLVYYFGGRRNDTMELLMYTEPRGRELLRWRWRWYKTTWGNYSLEFREPLDGGDVSRGLF